MSADDSSVVLLAGRHDITNIIYHELDSRFQIGSVLVENPVDRVRFLKRRGERLGWGRVAGQVLFRLGVMTLLSRMSRERIERIIARAEMNRAPIPDRRIVEVESVNDRKTIEELERQQPDVVVISGTRIISSDVLESVSAPFLNMHTGITPLYRGVHGGYWALAEGDEEHCGVTIHKLDEGIDTGGVVSQTSIEPTEEDNFATYPYLQFEAGLPLLVDAVRDAIDGDLETVEPPEGESKLWSHPTLWGYLSNWVRRGVT